MRVAHSVYKVRNYTQQINGFKYTVTVDEAQFNFYGQLKMGQIRKWRGLEEKSSSVTVSSRFGRKVMVVLAMNIRGICYYDILVKNETMDAVRYLEFLKGLVYCCHGYRKYAVWLIITPDLVNGISNVGCMLLIFPT